VWLAPGVSQPDQLRGDSNQIFVSEQSGFQVVVFRRDNNPVAPLLFGRIQGLVSHLEQAIRAAFGLKGRDLGQTGADGDHGRHLGSIMPDFQVFDIARRFCKRSRAWATVQFGSSKTNSSPP